jgi:hypothetical protein
MTGGSVENSRYSVTGGNDTGTHFDTQLGSVIPSVDNRLDWCRPQYPRVSNTGVRQVRELQTGNTAVNSDGLLSKWMILYIRRDASLMPQRENDPCAITSAERPFERGLVLRPRTPAITPTPEPTGMRTSIQTSQHHGAFSSSPRCAGCRIMDGTI